MAKHEKEDPKQPKELADDELQSVSGGASTLPMAQIKIAGTTLSSEEEAIKNATIQNIRA